MAHAVTTGGRFEAVRMWLTRDDPDSRSRHRDVTGGGARAAILGAGDGLVTNVSLVLGVAGASSSAGAVRIAGVAGLLAGAFSMAAGELVSVTAQRELAQRELEVERHELATAPDAELSELAAMYRAKGISEEDAWTVANILSKNEATALDTHARLELGIDPDIAGAPVKAASSSCVAFALGAALPLLPWIWLAGASGVVASVVIGACAALLLGGLVGALSGRSVTRSSLRQLAVAVAAAGVTFGIGHLLGASGV